MNTNSANFDNDECLHLAIEAVGRGDHGAALGYLKEGAARYPADARIAYMLGAEHAQIGLYDRAEAEMTRAIELDSGLHTARFQLGLLQLTQAKPAEATQTWLALDNLPEGHALRLFRDGLTALAGDRYDDARSQIQAGLAANDFSQELNRDMENLLARIPNQSGQHDAPPENTGHVWLNAYQNPDAN